MFKFPNMIISASLDLLDEVLTKVLVFSVFREQAITRMERTAIGCLFLPLKLGIEQINKVPGKIKISYLLVEIFEGP